MCSRRLRKRTKAEEAPNAACGFALWLLRFEALGGSRAESCYLLSPHASCGAFPPTEKTNIILFEHRNTKPYFTEKSCKQVIP